MSYKQKLYAKLKLLAGTKYGIFVMALLCFLECCISPITPLVMLIPMILMHREHMLRYVNIATIAAVIGSTAGYIIGYYLIIYFDPILQAWGFDDEFLIIENWFNTYGLLVFLPASILPFPPFKILTISSGLMHMKFLPFIVVVAIVRWLHFILLPAMAHFGHKAYLYKYEDKLTGEG